MDVPASKNHAKNKRAYQRSTCVTVFLKTEPLDQQYPALICVLYLVLVLLIV